MDLQMFKQHIENLEQENIIYERLVNELSSLKIESQDLNNQLIELIELMKE